MFKFLVLFLLPFFLYAQEEEASPAVTNDFQESSESDPSAAVNESEAFDGSFENEGNATENAAENTNEENEADENAENNATGSVLDDDEVLIEQIEKLNEVNESNFTIKPFIYNDRGRRDPFKPVIKKTKRSKKVETVNVDDLPELEKFRLDSFILTSIIWSVREPKALVLDPEKKTHLITKDTRIGNKNGYVAAIREGEIIVIEEDQDENGKSLFTTQVLKMGR